MLLYNHNVYNKTWVTASPSVHKLEPVSIISIFEHNKTAHKARSDILIT